jgi:hypothetical protein
MAEGIVQLPPNSTGAEMRTATGDGTNLIPSGVVEEVVVHSDAAGALPGDSRQAPIAVHDKTLENIAFTLSRILLVLETGLNVDIGD